MKALNWVLAGVLMSLCGSALAASNGNITVSHFEPLQRLSTQSKDASASQKLSIATPLTLNFDAFGQSFDLRLEPNDRFLSAAANSVLPAGVGIYRGSLANNPASWVRIVMFEGLPRGFIWDGQQLYSVEAPGDSIVEATSSIIYRLADIYIEPGSMTCGSKSLSGNGSATYSMLVGELNAAAARAPGAVSAIDIGTVADFSFTNGMGGDTDAAVAIVDRMNRVDGIFSQEIGVQINVPEIDTYSDSGLDPFGPETDPGDLLDQLTSYRQNTPAQNTLGLTHLWTGRDLDGSTVGIAYNGVLCRNSVGAGLSEGNGSASFDSLVAAHEIGHNFGAPHDGDPDKACASEPETFIMAPMINGSTEFSQCTIDIMEANAAAASCVTALPTTVDMSIALNNPGAVVLLGAETTLTYDLVNNGLLPAMNVMASFTIPANLEINSVAPSIGSCTDGAGTVDCDLGEVPGQSNNTVTISVTPTMVGSGLLTATVTADVDERLGINMDSMQLTVDPAVDLAVNSLPLTNVTLNASSTIVATLQNLSTLDATGVTLSASFGGRVRVESASWTIGTCTVAAQQIDCQAATFANLSSSTLTVSVTGLNDGKQDYSVTVSANEADSDLSNNSDSGTVNVRDPDDEESGGAVGLTFLWMLVLVAIVTRRLSGRLSNQRSQAL